MGKKEMRDSRRTILKVTGFDNDLYRNVSIKVDTNVVVVPHDPTSIVLFDQLVEAGKAFTPGPIDIAIVPDLGEMPVSDLEELSLKAKNINLEMYKHLQGLYDDINNVDRRLSDEHYQDALNDIIWAWDINQIFDYELEF